MKKGQPFLPCYEHFAQQKKGGLEFSFFCPLLKELVDQETITTAWVDEKMEEAVPHGIPFALTSPGSLPQKTTTNLSPLLKEWPGEGELQKWIAIVEQIGDTVCITDTQGMIEYVNQSFVELTGYSQEEALGNKPSMLKSGQYDADFYREMWEILLKGEVYQKIVVNKKKNGEIFYEMKTISPLRDEKGEISHFISTGKDVTTLVRAEEKLREERRKITTLLGNLSGMAYRSFCDENRTMERVSKGAKQLTGYSPFQLAHNKTIAYGDLIHPQEKEKVWAKISRALKNRKPFELTYRMHTAWDVEKWVLEKGCGIFSPQGKLVAIEGFVTDITGQKLLKDQILRDAFFDPVTELPNRACLVDRLNSCIKKASLDEDFSFALFLIDLDRFKIINDSLGHQLGDQFLQQVALRLSAWRRKNCTLGRFGGDEFVLIIEDVLSEEEVTARGKELLDEIAKPFDMDEQHIFITASMGIVISHKDYEKPEHYFRNADTAMFRAKGRGKGCYEVFHPTMHHQAIQMFHLEADLRRAMKKDEFQLFYQPLVSLETGKPVAFEALIRWFHPERGMVSPGDFIPLSEETGLIVPLGSFVIREACQQIKKWQDKFSMALPVSINVSSLQFYRGNLVEEVKGCLEESGISAQMLKLELTEGVLMGDEDEMQEILRQLKDLGLQLVIDDFGTGFSSLSYLHRFPVDVLKIDQSFVKKLGEGKDSDSLVRAMVNLGLALNMIVVAEGVETAFQWQKLQEMECQMGQGYYFYRPMPVDKVEEVIFGGEKLHP